jgi:NAD(P)-dependent dehydrogenase (short-subunit alcohol dehydrogenase family)
MDCTVLYRCFKNRSIIVFGGSSGIGLATALSFASHGATVFALSRRGKNLKNVNKVAIDRDLPGELILIEMDINDQKSFSSWIDKIEKDRPIDILVNSVGIYPQNQLIELKPDDWNQVFSTNLRSVFFTTQRVAQHMRDRNGGVITHISSFAAEIPSANSACYAASKAALKSLTQSMAGEWAPFNIRVNAVNPGVIQTKMTERAIEKNPDLLKSQIALHRIGDPQEAADAVLFLSSDKASYITGETLNVTGGKFIVQNPHVPWNSNKKQSEK